MKKIALIATVIAFTQIGVAYAQQSITGEEKQVSFKRWSITLTTGPVSGGPAGDIEQAMIESKFNLRSPDGFFGPGRDHPFSDGSGLGWMAEVQYKINTTFVAGLNYTYAGLPSSHGYHSKAHYLFVENISQSISTTVSIDLNRSLRLGLGPGIHFIESGDMDDTIVRDYATESSHTKLGFTFDLALRVPAKSRLYVDFNLRYRYVGDVAIGPLTAESFQGETAVFPKTAVNYNHFIAAAGIGIRL